MIIIKRFSNIEFEAKLPKFYFEYRDKISPKLEKLLKWSDNEFIFSTYDKNAKENKDGYILPFNDMNLYVKDGTFYELKGIFSKTYKVLSFEEALKTIKRDWSAWSMGLDKYDIIEIEINYPDLYEAGFVEKVIEVEKEIKNLSV